MSKPVWVPAFRHKCGAIFQTDFRWTFPGSSFNECSVCGTAYQGDAHLAPPSFKDLMAAGEWEQGMAARKRPLAFKAINAGWSD